MWWKFLNPRAWDWRTADAASSAGYFVGLVVFMLASWSFTGKAIPFSYDTFGIFLKSVVISGVLLVLCWVATGYVIGYVASLVVCAIRLTKAFFAVKKAQPDQGQP